MGNQLSPCPRATCKRKRRSGHAFCAQCWYELPNNMRDQIWRTWRNRINPDSKQSYPADREAHETAMQAALDFFAQEDSQLQGGVEG